MGLFAMDNGKNIVWVQGWRPKHSYVCTPRARKGVFGILGWVCLQWTMPKNIVSYRGGAPNTNMSVHHGPEKVFLDTWDGGL